MPITLALGTVLLVTPAEAQTFVQLSDLGSNLGPRLTAAVSRARLNRTLFGAIGTKVSFIDHSIVYQFASDPLWGRILTGRMDYWIHEYDNRSAPGGRLHQPSGIDISARKYFYAADRGKGVVLIAQFSPSAQNLVNPDVWAFVQFPRPVDVAWDGGTTPMTMEYLYVLDDSLSRVTYWDRSNLTWPNLLWSYGTFGNGIGQFSGPSGICVGKTVGSNSGTQFTTHFYVVDRGNRRIVWLNRGPSEPSWLGTISLGTWDPTDCAVDHFGNLYVTDQLSHRIHKFTYNLAQLATYGTYGKGATNLNTFAFPQAISVPCGLKIVNSQTVWYCEGRVITAEDWSETTGAVEHYLGLSAALTQGPDTGGGTVTFSYRVTDHAYHTIRLMNEGGQLIHEWYRGLMPSGNHSWFWGGSGYPEGYYAFRVDAVSAYGCSGQSWCAGGVSTSTFWNAGQPVPPPPPPPPPGECPPNCDQSPSVQDESPATLFLHQRVFVGDRPLTRITSGDAAAASASVPGSAGSLSELVRQHGIRGLAFGVPRSSAAATVSLRIYSVAGRSIRTLLKERMDPGYYEIAWDGLDDRGQAAAPGVYFAVLTAGGQQVTQRLILRQRP
ncbi:MAG TPA: FlgD immunoglobulin-like domain containing protein [Gemmatimonadales bacterium]|nr:FlgD immunoglobulin-like domain containing protein [Gemmatimonadales bacterium]